MSVHKCVRCGTVYPSGAEQLLQGCSCGSRVFAFVRGEAAEKMLESMNTEDLSWLEEELVHLVGDKPVSVEFDDAENIRILSKGHYALNLASLLAGDPGVIRASEGIYYLKLPSVKKNDKKR